MPRLGFYLLLSSFLVLGACSAMPVGNRLVPQPAKAVDLKAYAGLWYEVARFENRFEKDCEGVTAKYGLKSDGGISVLNTCVKKGKITDIKGRAKVVEGSQNAKLKVSFFGPFYGDYWILDRANDYSWAIVGEPSGKYLWLLSREAKPTEATRDDLKARAKALGYDLALIRQTQHSF
jgi:apolipoprotein D and lipocalin family protein